MPAGPSPRGVFEYGHLPWAVWQSLDARVVSCLPSLYGRKLRPGRCLGTPALLGIPGPPLVTLGRSDTGELETQVHCRIPMFSAHPFSSFPSSREIPEAGSICPHTPGDPFPSSLPLTLSSFAPSPDPRCLTRLPWTQDPCLGTFVLGIRELKFNLRVNLNSRVKRQLLDLVASRSTMGSCLWSCSEAAEMIHVKPL